jgi:hypothetical protein
MSKKDKANLSASKKKLNFARICLISVNKVARLRTIHHLLKIQNWAVNTEKQVKGQK